MMTKHSFLSNLGLAMRAGKVVSGDEAVVKSIRSGEAKLVIVANDASDNSKKKYRDKCATYQVTLLELCGREQLGQSIGRQERVVLAITEAGFANLLKKCLEKPAEVKEFE